MASTWPETLFHCAVDRDAAEQAGLFEVLRNTKLSEPDSYNYWLHLYNYFRHRRPEDQRCWRVSSCR